MKILATLLLLGGSSLVSAASPDYATQWPVLPARDGAGAYALTLTPAVYDTVQRADLRDLDVLDVRARPAPADVVASAAAPSTTHLELPWFAMPSPQGESASRWRVIADLDAEGRLRALRSSGTTRRAGGTTLVVDAVALQASARAGGDATLDVAWVADASFDRAYRVEGSDDFDDWRPVARGRLVDMRQDGRRLRLHRIELGEVAQRYLRLVPEDDGTPLPDITGVQVEIVRAADAPTAWLELAPHGAGRSFEFELPGRYPVRWVDLDVPGNDAREWRLQSRDGDGRWVDRVNGWAVFRVGAHRSPARVFDRPVRDRHWRLLGRTDGAPPRLRLGYRPERLVFVAAGEPPYTLVAGSAVGVRAMRPVHTALEADVPPADARLGRPVPRAGGAALERPRDWKTWGLWGVLALGVVIVGAFALRLLREPAPAVD